MSFPSSNFGSLAMLTSPLPPPLQIRLELQRSFLGSSEYFDANTVIVADQIVSFTGRHQPESPTFVLDPVSSTSPPRFPSFPDTFSSLPFSPNEVEKTYAPPSGPPPGSSAPQSSQRASDPSVRHFDPLLLLPLSSLLPPTLCPRLLTLRHFFLDG